MYPRIVADKEKLNHNAATVLSMCHQHGISQTFLVTKVLAGNVSLVSELAHHDFTYIADSRWQNLAKFSGIDKKKALLRLPMKAEIAKVVKYADLSLNSEISTIRLLDQEAAKQKRIHEVLLMFDLGDLREGLFYEDECLPVVREILGLRQIRLRGIGTNLTCYGGLIPTYDVLMRLVRIQKHIEQTLPIKLAIVSGGNSSSFHLFNASAIPKEINSLRFGEIVFLGRETAYGRLLPGLHADCFRLEAQLIEIQTKPSFPIGEIGMNSFGETPAIVDEGLMRRGILAVGKQDVMPDNLYPFAGDVRILGGSSDHLLVALPKDRYDVGDIMGFGMNYPGLLQLMTSPYVRKTVV